MSRHSKQKVCLETLQLKIYQKRLDDEQRNQGPFEQPVRPLQNNLKEKR